MSWGSWEDQRRRRGGWQNWGAADAASPGQPSSSRGQSWSSWGQAAAANPTLRDPDNLWVNFSLGDVGAQRIATRIEIESRERTEGMPGAGFWLRRGISAKMKSYMRTMWHKLTAEYENCIKTNSVFDVATYAKIHLSYEAYTDGTKRDEQSLEARAVAAMARGAQFKRDYVPVEYLGEEEVAHCSRCLVMAHTGRAAGTFRSEKRPLSLWDEALQRLQDTKQAQEDEEEHNREQDAMTEAACQLSLGTRTLDFSNGDLHPVAQRLDSTRARAPLEAAPSPEAMTDAVRAHTGLDCAAIIEFCKADVSTFVLSQSLEQCWSAAKKFQNDETAQNIELWMGVARVFATWLCNAVLGPGHTQVSFFGSFCYFMSMHDSDVDLVAYINPQCGMQPIEMLAKAANLVLALKRAYDNFVALRLLRQADDLGVAVWVLHSIV